MTPLTFQDYQTLAMSTQANLPPRYPDSAQWQTINAVMGLAGEAGEAMDLVKKWLFHHHDLDYNKLDKEIGDILWYCAQYADSRGDNLGALAWLNLEKLRARYPDGFTTEASMNRAHDDV